MRSMTTTSLIEIECNERLSLAKLIFFREFYDFHNENYDQMKLESESFLPRWLILCSLNLLMNIYLN